MNENNVGSKDNNEQLCLVVIDPNKPDTGSNDKNMADSLRESKLASESTENRADMAGGDLTNKNPDSDCELSTQPKLVAQSKDDCQDIAVKRLGFCLIGGEDTVEQLNKDNQQRVKDNTAANSGTSLWVASLNKNIIPGWKLSQHESRSSSSAGHPVSFFKQRAFEKKHESNLINTK